MYAYYRYVYLLSAGYFVFGIGASMAMVPVYSEMLMLAG